MGLVIPNVFGAASGNVAASQLDANWNTIRDWINPRNPTSGTLAARPAFGNTGALYLATDSGIMFLDSGTAWLAVSPVLTQGSVVFAGAGGLLSQDNASLFWDSANKRLGIGTNAPDGVGGGGATVHLKQAVDIQNVLRVEIGTSVAPITGLTNRVWNRIDVYEKTTPGAGIFSEAFGVHLFVGPDTANGERNCLVGLVEVSGGAFVGSSKLVGVQGIARSRGIAGAYFGMNPVAELQGPVNANASLFGAEINTDMRVAGGMKVGLQIVDVATSVGVPGGAAPRNVALRLVNQTGAYGFDDGILFDNGPAASVRTTGTLIRVLGGSYASGLDLSGGTFSGPAIKVGAGFMEAAEIATPGIPPLNTWRLYARDNGFGKTQLVVRFPSGSEQQIAVDA